MIASNVISMPFNDPRVSHRIVGTCEEGSGIFGYYTREDVGSALIRWKDRQPEGNFWVERHNPLLTGKALRSTDVEWIVNNMGELGVKIGDQMFFLYKGESVMYAEDCLYRPVEKREFGEVCRAPDRSRYTDVPNNDSQYDIENHHDGWKPVNADTANNEVGYANSL